MDEKTRDDFIKLFNQGFEEIVLPHIEELREDVDALKSEVHEIHLKLGVYKDKSDFEIDKIKDHLGLATTTS